MAYATRMAAALTGATVSQLRHWRTAKTGPLLAPEIQSAPKALYLVAGLVAEGVSPEDISKYYPAVTADAARDAIDFAHYVDSLIPGRKVA